MYSRKIARAVALAAVVAVAAVASAPATAEHEGPWHTTQSVVTPEGAPIQTIAGLIGGGGNAISADGNVVAYVGPAPEDYPDCTTTACWTFYATDMTTDESTVVGIAWDADVPSIILPVPVISDDGRFLMRGMEGQLVRTEIETGQSVIVSVSSGGTNSNAGGGDASLSADGRYVAFASLASNLVAGDDNDCPSSAPTCSDIFVRDVESGTTERVSVASDGSQANERSLDPDISADGRYVVFASQASDLAEGDRVCTPLGVPDCEDVFRHDRTTGETVLVSANTLGIPGNASSINPAVSADGRYVAFSSLASDLVANDTNGDNDIFVRDMVSGSTERISVRANGSETSDGFGSNNPTISDDGRRVAFDSDSADLDPGASDNCNPVKCRDIFVRELATGETFKANVSLGGAHSDRRSFDPVIAAGGRHVMFSSGSDKLIEGVVGGMFIAEREGFAWGDFDCDGAEDAGDALIFLETLAGLLDPPDCLATGSIVNTSAGVQDWGDWDCNGAMLVADIIPLLRHAALLETGGPECPVVSSTVFPFGI